MRHRFRIKESLKVALKRAVSAPNRRHPEAACILTYHSVGNRDHPMNVSLEAFRDQISWLADSHRCITVQEALAGRHGVALTFDDGYRDNLHNAYPVLEKHHVPWTLFFVAGRAASTLAHDSDAVNATLLNWDEVRTLHAAGVEIGGHTLTHPRLSAISEEEQRDEIAGCFETIRAELGLPPAGFAYPYGSALDFTSTTVALVQETGFAYALSNRYGALQTPADRWTSRRIWIDRTDTLAFFKDKVEGRLDRLRFLDSPPGIYARQIINRF